MPMPSRKRYEYVGHMADVEFIAYGKDDEECFRNAMLALFDTISYKRKLALSKSRVITFAIKDRAKTIEDLLWYMLQDAVSIMDSKRLFGYDVADLKLNEGKGIYTINASIKAKARNAGASKLDVKGVSRYDLKIKRKKSVVEASVVLDV